MVVASSSCFYYSYFIPIMESIKSSYFSIVPIRFEKSERKKEKVSGPKWNHNYISYSDMLIRYRWNRGSGPLISLDHVRIHRPIESSCFWMLHRHFSLFLSSTEKSSFRVTRAIYFFFLFVMVMQCKRSEIWLFLMMKGAFFMLCEIDENPIFKGR